jgi:hypothetical protein
MADLSEGIDHERIPGFVVCARCREPLAGRLRGGPHSPDGIPRPSDLVGPLDELVEHLVLRHPNHPPALDAQTGEEAHDTHRLHNGRMVRECLLCGDALIVDDGGWILVHVERHHPPSS